MDLNQIKLVLDIARHGSLTQAAVALGIEQSVISRQLSALEKDYGERLFHRTGRGMSLTDFGETILPKLNWLIDEANRIDGEIKDEAGIVSGNVRIGLLPALSNPIISRLLPRVSEHYDRVHLHFFEGSNGQLQEWLVNGTIDLAILYRYGGDNTVTERVLGTNDAHLIGSVNSPLLQGETVEFRALDGLPLVVPSMPNALRNTLNDAARQHGIRLNVIAEADSISIQKSLARLGQAYVILGSLVIEDNERSVLRSARIVDPVIRRTAVLAISARKPLTTAMRTVFTEIEDLAKPLLDH